MQKQKKQASFIVDKTHYATNIKHSAYSEDTSKICNCPAQFDLKDSLKLKHIKNDFYESETGHLYEKTIGTKEIDGHLTDYEYFNGSFSQEVDPLTFKALNGWYAKDSNHVYYYRPVSGGTQISKIDVADSKTVKMLEGHYKYAVDKSFFFDETEIIEGFEPNKTKFKLDNKGRVTEMICSKKNFKFELVN